MGDLQARIKGPDFPTGGCIQGLTGIRNYQKTGRGEITIRARAEIDTSEDTARIIVSDIPYRVSFASMIERIADEVRSRRIDGIADLRNESTRDGPRIVIGLKPGVNPDALLRQLYARTPMQATFAVALVALVADPATGGMSRDARLQMLTEELRRVATTFGDSRRTQPAGMDVSE